jgi:adenine-specific DNA-methyltransferase
MSKPLATLPPQRPAPAGPPGLLGRPGLRALPRTRYQGSKRKLCGWIAACLEPLEFTSVLDAFSGTASVGYLLKGLGKQVTCNDVLAANWQIATALVANDNARLSRRTIDRLVDPATSADEPTFIRDTFAGIYFTDAENAWLDRVCRRIRRMRNAAARAIAWYALFQSALAKRPYNLFHRRNLYMRTADVPRSFGNKRSWDRHFEAHFRAFADEANQAVFAGERTCRAIRGNAVDAPGAYDLVYIDPPYLNRKGVGVDYAHFYHFLEGLVDYPNWPQRVDRATRHRRMRAAPSPWTQPAAIGGAFAEVFARFADAMLVVSYRNDGIPSIEEIRTMLKKFKRRVVVHEHTRYQYALSTRRQTREALLIGT